MRTPADRRRGYKKGSFFADVLYGRPFNERAICYLPLCPGLTSDTNKGSSIYDVHKEIRFLISSPCPHAFTWAVVIVVVVVVVEVVEVVVVVVVEVVVVVGVVVVVVVVWTSYVDGP